MEEKSENKPTTKIQAVIQDTVLRLLSVKEQIMLLSREREVLQKQIEMFDIIQNDKTLV